MLRDEFTVCSSLSGMYTIWDVLVTWICWLHERSTQFPHFTLFLSSLCFCYPPKQFIFSLVLVRESSKVIENWLLCLLKGCTSYFSACGWCSPQYVSSSRCQAVGGTHSCSSIGRRTSCSRHTLWMQYGTIISSTGMDWPGTYWYGATFVGKALHICLLSHVHIWKLQ
jgi:hypothetical protein